MVKLTAALADDAASLSEAMTLPIKAVMSRVQSSAVPRTTMLRNPDIAIKIYALRCAELKILLSKDDCRKEV